MHAPDHAQNELGRQIQNQVPMIFRAVALGTSLAQQEVAAQAQECSPSARLHEVAQEQRAHEATSQQVAASS